MPYADFDPDDRDAPQEIDLDHDDDASTADCPFCGQPVVEDTPRCPHCGQWVVFSEADKRSRGWFWPVMVAILVAVVLVLWHGLGRSP